MRLISWYARLHDILQGNETDARFLELCNDDIQRMKSLHLAIDMESGSWEVLEGRLAKEICHGHCIKHAFTKHLQATQRHVPEVEKASGELSFFSLNQALRLSMDQQPSLLDQHSKFVTYYRLKLQILSLLTMLMEQKTAAAKTSGSEYRCSLTVHPEGSKFSSDANNQLLVDLFLQMEVCQSHKVRPSS